MTNDDLAHELLERLKEFSPAVSISPGQDDDQVIVEIVMSRTPHKTPTSKTLANARQRIGESNRLIRRTDERARRRRRT